MLAHPRGRGLQTHGTYHAHTHKYTHTTYMAHRCHIHRWPSSVSPVGGFSVSGEQGLSVGTPTSKAPAGLLGPLLAVAPAGLGTSPSCSSVAVSLRSSSIPHFGLGLFQPLPHFQLPPVSAALIFCLLEWAPGQGPSLELRPCTPVIQPSAHLRTAPCPASLLWPQHLALCPGTASPEGTTTLASSSSLRSPCSSPPEAGQRAGPWGGHSARTRVLASGRNLALAAEPHWPGPTLSPGIPGAS